MSAFRFTVCLLTVLLIPTMAQAMVIKDLTAGRILFFDNFEGVPASTTAGVDLSGDYDPVAMIGTWDLNEQSPDLPLQVTSSTTSPDPGPYRGSQYLRYYRDSGAAFSSEARAVPATELLSGHRIEMSTMVYIPSTDDSYPRFQIGLERPSGNPTSNPVVLLREGDGRGVLYPDPALVAWAPTGLSYATDTWQKWSFEYVVGSGTFDLTVGSGHINGLAAWGGGGAVSDVYFANGVSSPGSFYLDSVDATPEPGMLVILSTGVFSLLAYAWRKRR
jgi:hypothetical protein